MSATPASLMVSPEILAETADAIASTLAATEAAGKEASALRLKVAELEQQLQTKEAAVQRLQADLETAAATLKQAAASPVAVPPDLAAKAVEELRKAGHVRAAEVQALQNSICADPSTAVLLLTKLAGELRAPTLDIPGEQFKAPLADPTKKSFASRWMFNGAKA